MTDEQRYRIHDITYSTQDRAELAERIVGLEDENADMKRRLERAKQLLGKRKYDIEKLRELVSQSQTDLESELDNAEQMEVKEEMYKAENAKLRELALENWFIAMSERLALMAHGINIDGIGLDVEICNARDKMRELGIEVD